MKKQSKRKARCWISVAEQLPNEHEIVICHFCGIVSYGKWSGRVWVVNDEPETSLVKTDIISFVTHWRPFPKAPKKVREVLPRRRK